MTTQHPPVGLPPPGPLPPPYPVAPQPSQSGRHVAVIVMAVALVVVALIIAVAWVVVSSGHETVTPASSSTVSGAPAVAGGSGSDADQRFLYALSQGGVTYTAQNGIAGAVGVGHTVCGALSAGATIPQEIGEITTQTVFTQQQAVTIVGSSIGAYCPQFTPR